MNADCSASLSAITQTICKCRKPCSPRVIFLHSRKVKWKEGYVRSFRRNCRVLEVVVMIYLRSAPSRSGLGAPSPAHTIRLARGTSPVPHLSWSLLVFRLSAFPPCSFQFKTHQCLLLHFPCFSCILRICSSTPPPPPPPSTFLALFPATSPTARPVTGSKTSLL